MLYHKEPACPAPQEQKGWIGAEGHNACWKGEKGKKHFCVKKCHCHTKHFCQTVPTTLTSADVDIQLQLEVDI